MKKALITSVALGALMTGNALAANLPVKAPIMKAPPAPAFSWTGCYLDAGVGYGMWNQDHNTTFASGVTDLDNTGGGRGWLGRFGGGCDYQLTGTFSNFVIGAFGDYDVMDLDGSFTPFAVTRGGRPITGDEKESSAWAAGGRVGYLLTPTIMTYVDGGWTQTRFDQINQTDNLGVPTGTAAPAHTYNGWFLGSGFEYNFNWLPIPGLFLRTEYRYASYNRDDLANFSLATGVPNGNVVHSEKFVQTVTTSLVWRFNTAGNPTAASSPVKPLLTKAPPVPAYSWTGCYLDAGAGYGLWNQDHDQTFFNGVTVVENTGGGRGWLGRFGGGCDYQATSSFVIGAFGDYDVMDLNGSFVPLAVTAGGGIPEFASERESSAWAAGGRVGYLLTPTILTYVDGGWTQTRFDQMNEITSVGAPTAFGFPAHTYNGWLLGSGFEQNFNWLPLPGLFLRTEYRYSSYNRDDLPEIVLATGTPGGNVSHAKKFVQTVTTSLVWRFNGFH